MFGKGRASRLVFSSLFLETYDEDIYIDLDIISMQIPGLQWLLKQKRSSVVLDKITQLFMFFFHTMSKNGDSEKERIGTISLLLPAKNCLIPQLHFNIELICSRV